MKTSHFLIVLVAALVWFMGRYLYLKPSAAYGTVAPDFLIADNTKISDLKGNFVLLDFWGSWCPPCIREAPELVSLYQKFKDKSLSNGKKFEIVSIGIENDSAKWQASIQRLGFSWRYHYSDLKRFDSPIAKLYGVRSIPTKILLNTEGVIVAVNPTFADLEKTLADNFK